jgi:uncharacterized protein (TIGR03067 family)
MRRFALDLIISYLISLSALASVGLARTTLAGMREVKDDIALLKGRWKVVLEKRDGKLLKHENNRTFTFSENELVIAGLGSGSARLKYRINSAKNPKTIDLANLDTKSMDSLVGIYEVHGNELKLCLTNAAFKRPSSFDHVAPIGPVILVKLQREPREN